MKEEKDTCNPPIAKSIMIHLASTYKRKQNKTKKRKRKRSNNNKRSYKSPKLTMIKRN